MTPYWRALINTINKVVYTLNEPETNCAKSTSDLNSAILGLTDKCLVPLIFQRIWKESGSDKIALREPLYVFAVNDDLTAK